MAFLWGRGSRPGIGVDDENGSSVIKRMIIGGGKASILSLTVEKTQTCTQKGLAS